MIGREKRVPARSQRLTLAKLTPPEWYGWAGVAAMFLLPAVRINLADGPWYFPLLSLGEWLLLPLGVCSITMGFLSLSRIREKTLLPLWISAIVPALLWLAAMALATANNGVTSAGGDMLLSWAVHLIFPTMVFLPLFTMRVWRNRLMWALALGLVVNAAAIFWQGQTTGIAPPAQEALSLGGFLASQHDYGVMLAVALPLLAAWRGGHERKNSLAILLCTFLLPVLALAACNTASGFIAVLAGITIAWAAWRSHAWILGIFLCLAVFGYGAESQAEHDRNQRRLLVDSVVLGDATFKRALNTFQARPVLGSGPESFCSGTGHEPTGSPVPNPWYAFLLGGSGIVGVGMWMVLLAELAARTMGRFGRRCLWHGGVLGGVAALTIIGFWTDVMPEGAGALIGVLIALSILEEPDASLPPKRAGRRNRNELQEPIPVSMAAPAAPAKGERASDTDIVPKG